MVHLVGYFGCAAISIVMMGVVFHALVWPTLKCRKKSVLGLVVSVVFGFGMLHSMAVKPGGGDALQGPRRSPAQQAATNDTPNIVTTASSNLWEHTLAVKSVIYTPTNFTIEAAWPTEFFDEVNKIDLFVSTSSPSSNFNWVASLPITQADTNCFFTIDPYLLETDVMPQRLFAKVADRISACLTMSDDDGDGIPAHYEFYYGTNPYLDDAAAIPRLTVGPGGTHPDLASALAASTPYSIIQLEATETASTSFTLPDHPVLITGPRNGYSVIRSSADHGAFKIMDGQDYRTMLRNIYLVLEKRGSFQVGFYCGRNLPWTGTGATPTFENIVVRTPRSETQYIGWLYYGDNGETSTLKNCLVNALGATKVRGVEIGNGPNVLLSDVTFTNFPARSEQTLSRTFSRGNNGQTNTIVRQGAEGTVFVDLTPGVDSDGDGYTNIQELEELHTDPWLADSDGDGLTDPEEFLAGTDPTNVLSFLQGFFIHVTNTTVISESSVYLSYQIQGSSPVVLTNSPARSFDIAVQMERPSGQMTVSAFRDMNGNGAFDENYDVLIAIEAPSLSETAHLNFSFGDIDKDGVYDDQERVDGTDPYSAQSLKITRTVYLANDDSSAPYPSYYARSSLATVPQSNEFVLMTRDLVTIHVSTNVAAGCAYVFCFRDLNGNGLFDEASDIIYRFRVTNGADDLTISFRDADGDTIPDSDEVAHLTDPIDAKSYCYKPTLIVNGIFATTNALLYRIFFGTNELGSARVASNATEVISCEDFLVTTNAERFVVRFFDDTNGNARPDDGEPCITITTPPSGLLTTNTVRLSLGPFDANYNSIPDWWEISHGLKDFADNGEWYADPDNDGVINLHEYWADTDPLIPNVSNSIFSVLSRSIDNRLTDSSASRKNLFDSNYPTLLHPNTNCWAYGIDLTCASPYNSASGRFRAGTAITDQHIVLANHFNYSSGTRVDFVDTNGQTVSRRVLAGTRIASSDIYICLLDTPLPPTVHPAQLLPSNYRDYIGTGQGLPILMLDQDEHAIVADLSSYFGNTSPHNPIRQLYHETIISGDSGDPVFLIFENKPILLYTFFTAGGGPSLADYADAIQSAMDLLSLQNGQDPKSLSFVDFSQFVTVNGVLR